MATRSIIKIDQSLCDGCEQCIPNCPEGAIQVIDGKARLVSDLFCDGLGACIGHCPQGAITIEEREAEPYNEWRVMANVVQQGTNTIAAHLAHLRDHNEFDLLSEALAYLKENGIPVPPTGGGKVIATMAPAACPGSKTVDLREASAPVSGETVTGLPTQLRQWPVQITLVPPHAPFLNGCDLLIAADCVPFAYPDFHQELLKGKVLLVGCPKLDDVRPYEEKLTQIFAQNEVKSITYARMEVPCCGGFVPVIRRALAASGKEIPFQDIVIGIRGNRLK
ncbi:MAG TPA: 4Fe-4S binding protein [Candidatus Latescibacteria bacterium]|nr:4Fe-4S binding protein [Candidatus Latescibacterota bacterium]